MMMKYLDVSSIIVAATTLVLFIAALFIKGFTHDLLIEAGIFLISVKLIMMVYKNGVAEQRLEAKLDTILDLLKAGKI